jgi:hypothetical protein
MNSVAFVTLLLISVLVGGAYTLLGLKAKAHLTSAASASDRSIGWLFWWSMDKELYDAEGKRLCKTGNLLVIPLLALYVAWYLLILK